MEVTPSIERGRSASVALMCSASFRQGIWMISFMARDTSFAAGRAKRLADSPGCGKAAGKSAHQQQANSAHRVNRDISGRIEKHSQPMQMLEGIVTPEKLHH